MKEAIKTCATALLFGCLVGSVIIVGHAIFGHDQRPAIQNEPNDADAKPVFIYFGATWCGPCNQMKSTTFKDAKVIEVLAGYKTTFVDVDRDPVMKRKFKVTSIPAYLVVDTADRVLVSRGTGYRGPQAFLIWLKGGE